MKITFENINDNITPWDNFPLKWRFYNSDQKNITDFDLNQIRPLNLVGAQFIQTQLDTIELHKDFPFNKNLFAEIKKNEITDYNHDIIRNRLMETGIELDNDVYLSWNNDTALIVPWSIFIKYFDDFFYPSSDDLTIIDNSLNWSLLFFHTNEIYLGTTKDFIENKTILTSENDEDPTSIRSAYESFDDFTENLWRQLFLKH